MASVRSAAMVRYGSIYLDGLVNEAGVSFNELSAIERIEVLKGPSSMLFGWTPLRGLTPGVNDGSAWQRIEMALIF